MLWEAKHDFVVIWGNIQKPKSQRHPCHNCWAKPGVGHHPRHGAVGAGVHFIPCVTWERGFQPPFRCFEVAYRHVLTPSLGTSNTQLSLCSTRVETPRFCPCPPQRLLPPGTPLLLLVVFLGAPNHELKMSGAGDLLAQSEQVGGALSPVRTGQRDALQTCGAGADVLHTPHDYRL